MVYEHQTNLQRKKGEGSDPSLLSLFTSQWGPLRLLPYVFNHMADAIGAREYGPCPMFEADYDSASLAEHEYASIRGR